MREPQAPIYRRDVTAASRDHRLFVYGTLAPGRPNEHILAGLVGEWQQATVSGRLEQAGWGAALGYPALVPGAEGEVEGFLFSSPDLPGSWGRLDVFEGDEYVRVRVSVRLPLGEQTDAWAYARKQGTVVG